MLTTKHGAWCGASWAEDDPPQRLRPGVPGRCGGCRFVWIADLLPNEVAPAIAAMIEQGIATIKETLERTERDQAA
jgi:hypothetical protein